MDISPVTKSLFLAMVATIFVAGCSGQETVMKHSQSEQKAMDAFKTMTPQQHIDFIQKGMMPEAAKQAMIKKIKEENGIK